MRFVSLFALVLLVACDRGRPQLEARTFDLRYLNPGDAEQMIRPYVFSDREDAEGTLVMTRTGISVRETRDNLDRIARVLAEHDRPPLMVRLHFQVIRANGAGPRDSTIAAVEEQLRQLFRFRGYRLVAQGMTTGSAPAPIQLRLNTADGSFPYLLSGDIRSVTGTGDSGAVRMVVVLREGPLDVLTTEISVGIGQTMVLGGQAGTGPGAVILAVRAERVR